jgi:hypothetical protein
MSLTGKQIKELKTLYESVYEEEEVVHITEELYKEYLYEVFAVALVESGALDVEFENEDMLEKILVQEGLGKLIQKGVDYAVKNPKKTGAVVTGLLGLDQIRQDSGKDYLSGKRFVDLRTLGSTLKGLPNFIKGRRTMVQTNTQGTGDQVVDVSGSDVEDKIKSSKDKSTTKYLDKYLKDKRKRLDKEMG